MGWLYGLETDEYYRKDFSGQRRFPEEPIPGTHFIHRSVLVKMASKTYIPSAMLPAADLWDKMEFIEQE